MGRRGSYPNGRQSSMGSRAHRATKKARALVRRKTSKDSVTDTSPFYDDLHLFPRVKIPRYVFPRGFLQGTNFARHLFSKGEGFPSVAIARGSNSKGIYLHVLHIPREHFPRPNFQGPISKVQFPSPSLQPLIRLRQITSGNKIYLYCLGIPQTLKQTKNNT